MARLVKRALVRLLPSQTLKHSSHPSVNLNRRQPTLLPQALQVVLPEVPEQRRASLRRTRWLLLESTATV